MLSESQGREVLARCFRAAGYDVAEHVAFAVAGRTIHLDGYDAARRVGYEFVSDEDGRDEVTPEVMAALDAGNAAGEFCILLVDEDDVADADELEEAARRFLERAAS